MQNQTSEKWLIIFPGSQSPTDVTRHRSSDQTHDVQEQEGQRKHSPSKWAEIVFVSPGDFPAEKGVTKKPGHGIWGRD